MTARPSPPTIPDTASPSYRATMRAWANIWRDTDIERELLTREYARSQSIRRRFMPHLPAGEPILEAGCGLGVELLGLHDQKFFAVGVDYVADALGRLKIFRNTLRLAAGDIHALPFRDHAFGAYLSFGVLEHFEFGPAPGLSEAARVLRTDGVLIVTVPAPNYVRRLADVRRRLAAPRGAPRTTAAGYYETTYSAAELARYVEAAGFEIVERRPVGHSFTLWGCGSIFRGPKYYETTRLAELGGAVLARVLPWSMSFATLIIARKRGGA